MYFPASAEDLILSLVNSVIRLPFVYREKEHITGASHTPGNLLKQRALDIFNGLGPWYAEPYIKSFFFFFC